MDLLPYVRMEMVDKLRFYAVLFTILIQSAWMVNGVKDWEYGWSITIWGEGGVGCWDSWWLALSTSNNR